jgi:hypothetical protein
VADIEITNADWGKIHAMAWHNRDEDRVDVRDSVSGRTVKKSFREALESDPTAAITFYIQKHHPDLDLQTVNLKIVKLRPPPDDIPEDFWEDVNPFPPSCC